MSRARRKTTPGTAPSAAPVNPPKPNKPLLVVASALVAGWIAALVWLVLAG
ncbi:MAG: hypothetical protein KJZ87_16240 [Thermoguttaceae bacterium]|nr:hypothetical protein [Thermoguttaceae bacterium]